MKFFESDYLYSHSWENVTTAVWKKYPNDNAQHVLSIDTISQKVDPATGILKVERVFALKQNVPYLLKQVLGCSDHSYVHEVCEIDSKNKKFVATTNNLSYTNLMNIKETVTYTPDPQNSERTLFQQQAQFTALGNISKLASYVEEFSIQRFSDNAVKGREGFINVLEKLFGKKEQPMTGNI
ncbi:protein MSF1 [Neoconidiobolus thromboides FSU 785]|nr:protein MSF1 [Neoconidiobolus thromboides FSU 785]